MPIISRACEGIYSSVASSTGPFLLKMRASLLLRTFHVFYTQVISASLLMKQIMLTSVDISCVTTLHVIYNSFQNTYTSHSFDFCNFRRSHLEAEDFDIATAILRNPFDQENRSPSSQKYLAKISRTN